MRYLYYCNSTYQLLNVLNLHWHRKNANFENINDYHAELILLNTFEGAEAIYEQINKHNVFDRTILMEKTYNKGNLHSVFSVIDLVSPAFYLKSKHHLEKKDFYNKYDVITTPKYSALIDEIWRLNRNASLDLIEDGMATYQMNMQMEPNSERIKKIRRILSYNNFYEYRHLYLVSEKLYTGADVSKVREIPAFDDVYFEELKMLFSSFNIYSTDKKIYWLSQFLNNQEFNEMVDQLLQILSDYKSDVLFCQHPRNHLENRYLFEETDGKQIWELMILDMADINNKLFISIHSTASFTAKMLYDKEPYIILYYKLGDREVTAVSDEFERSVELFRNSYSNPEKIMIPETIEEFTDCLQRYMTKVCN